MKKIVMACGLFVLGVLAVGCGKNKCETAADDILGKAEECGLTTELMGSIPSDERWAAAFKGEGIDPRLLASETGAA